MHQVTTYTKNQKSPQTDLFQEAQQIATSVNKVERQKANNLKGIKSRDPFAILNKNEAIWICISMVPPPSDNLTFHVIQGPKYLKLLYDNLAEAGFIVNILLADTLQALTYDAGSLEDRINTMTKKSEQWQEQNAVLIEEIKKNGGKIYFWKDIKEQKKFKEEFDEISTMFDKSAASDCSMSMNLKKIITISAQNQKYEYIIEEMAGIAAMHELGCRQILYPKTINPAVQLSIKKNAICLYVAKYNTSNKLTDIEQIDIPHSSRDIVLKYIYSSSSNILLSQTVIDVLPKELINLTMRLIRFQIQIVSETDMDTDNTSNIRELKMLMTVLSTLLTSFDEVSKTNEQEFHFSSRKLG